MSELQEVFNNREIAVGMWVILVVVISLFTKPVHQFLKSVFPILFCHKFVAFYIIFLSYFGLVTYGLYAIGFGDVSLLKDTIFWILFLELPLFVKTIEKAKDNHFFTQLIKENIAFIVIIEFILNFWTSDMEVPIMYKGKKYYLCMPFKSGVEITGKTVPVDVSYQIVRPFIEFRNCMVVFVTAKKCSENLMNYIKKIKDSLGWPIEVIEGNVLAGLLMMNGEL